MTDRVLLGMVLLGAITACGDDESSPEPEPDPEVDARAEPERDAAGEPPPDSGSDMDGGRGPTPVGLDQWTMMGGDATNRYLNSAETAISVANASMLEEKWRFTVAGFPAGSPVIADGKVFVIATGNLTALDLDSGAMLWQRTDRNGSATPAYADGALYVHTAGADLYKLDGETGDDIWGPSHTNDQAGCDGTSSPILGDGKVLVGHSCGAREVGATPQGMLGGVAAFDQETGEKAWTYYTVAEGGEDGAMVWSTVAVDVENGTVFAATGNNYTVGGENSDAIHAIDLDTGASPPKWRTQVRAGDTWSYAVAGGGQDTDFGANPILAEVDGRAVVAAGDKGAAFWMLDRETGEMIWGRDDLSASHTPNNGGVLMNGAFDGHHFYAVSNDPTAHQAILHKMDPADGADVWTQVYDKLTWGAPSLANGVLFVPINDDLYVLDADGGDMLTMFNTGGSIAAGAAAIAQGRVVVKSGLNYIFGGTDAIANNQVICYGLPE